MTADLYERITQQIIAAVEAGAGEYRMPWNSGGAIGTPMNAVSGRSYRGVNTLLLWAAASQAGYGTGEWATYRQWAARGARVRKGQRATTVLLWKPVDRRSAAEEGDSAERRLVARAFQVFNADQVDGHLPRKRDLTEGARIAAAEAFVAAQPAVIWARQRHCLL